MFNISLTDLTERREERLEWHSEPEDVNLCIMKGLDEVSHETRRPRSEFLYKPPTSVSSRDSAPHHLHP